MSIFTELKRRNVFKVGIAYAIVAWLLIQVVAIVLPTFDAPRWVQQTITFIIILGFPIALFLAWAYELTPEGIKPTPPTAPAESVTHETGKKLNYTIIGLMALVIVFLVVDNYVLTNKGDEEQGVKSEERAAQVQSGPVTTTTAVSEQKPAVPRNSIAVLPFTDMSPNKDQDYFADGIAEEILNSLAGIKDLEVRGRTSSFYFKGKHEELSTISDMLHVEYVLEGSVRKDADQVRITVQLINAQKDEHLWSKTYDHKLKDIFVIQEDIARSIADTLQITLGVGMLGRTPGMTRNVDAYDAYLAGLSMFYKLGRENNSRAMESLEKAVTLDPDFAVAWIYLASVYNDSARIFKPDEAKKYETKRESALAHAIAITPNSVTALLAEAGLHEQRREWTAAEQSFKKAFALAPTDYGTNIQYGFFLTSVGRPAEAIDFTRRAVQIEPLSSISYSPLGTAYFLSGKSAAAKTTFKRSRELSEEKEIGNISLLIVAMSEHNEGLIRKYERLLVNPIISPDSNRPDSSDINKVMIPLLDKPDAARAKLRQYMNDPAYNNTLFRTVVALWASYYGEYGLALRALQEASNSNSFYEYELWMPLHKPVRRLSGFKEIVTKMGLVDYWRSTGNWGEFCHPVGEDDFECE